LFNKGLGFWNEVSRSKGKMKEMNTKKTIYIIDDDVIYATLMEHQLSENQNLDVKVFYSAEHYFNTEKKLPDLFILDFYLNGVSKENMDGHKALEQIEILNPNQKVIFMSGQKNTELLAQYRKYRNIDFLLKSPIGDDNMLQFVENKLKLTKT